MAPKQAGGSSKTTAAGRKGAGRRSDLGSLSRIYVHAAVFLGLLAAWAAWKQLSGPSLPPQITPLKAPLMKQLPEFDAAYKDAMLWGSYRAGHYFGMRTRTARPLLLGLMWFDATTHRANGFTPDSIRHEAQQQDRLTSYGWLRHDGRSYGRQQLIDGDFDITLQMVKRASEGSGPGGDWAVRIKAGLSTAGQQAQEAERAASEEAGGSGKPRQRRLSLLLYFADAHWHTGEVEMWPQGQQSKVGQGAVLLSGDNEDIGPWALHLLPGPTTATAAPTGGSSSSGPSKAAVGAKLHFLGMRLQDGQQLVQLRQFVAQALIQTAQRLGFDSGIKLWLPNISQPRPNLAVFQLNFAAPAEFDLVLLTQPDSSTQHARLEALHGAPLTALAAQHEATFDDRFAATFPITSAPADLDPTTLSEASKAALSNTLGSMGYFVGASRVKLPPGVKPPPPRPGTPTPPPGTDLSVVHYWREALFTATPSRSFFPRGFLWDEGFHQLLVSRWDGQMSRDAISHWLDLMNSQGWIPREQILGKEARARVPGEFLVQHPSHANPPSLYLPLLAHAATAAASGGDSGKEEAQRAQAFLKRAWPRLEAWYHWFNSTQAGSTPGSYMWKGRDATTDRELNPKTLMSGLDDYPRASHPTQDERHVDLLAWMALASQAMAAIGTAAGAPAKAVQRYASAAAAIGSMQRLRALHYDAGSGSFRDYGLHTEAVEMVWRDVPVPEGQPPQREFVRQVNEAPSLQYVPDFGYVSLFPLLMQLLPAESDELGQQLRLLQRQDLLWTPQGLRSLATTSSIYNKYNTEHDAPYWRGPIWININYLTLRALKHYSSTPGPHQEAASSAYQQLRANLLGNLVRQYSSTGYLWEQYSDEDGKPKGCHPFTGWTALLTLIASEAY